MATEGTSGDPAGARALSAAVERPRAGRRLWRSSVLVFILVAAVYALVAWDRLAEPTPQFHFIDLAQSLLDGRLDTDTPNERSRRARDDDPPGYRDAIRRVEESGGWNDWAMVRRLTLRGGDVYVGRFAWPDAEGERRHLFHTIDNYEIKIVVPRDLARTCGESGRRLCDERVHYVSFPPLPALVFAPMVAAAGYEVNDVIVTIIAGALNAVLLLWLLELLVARGYSHRSLRDNLWLTFAFAFGTVAFFSAVRGEVWFTALIFGVGLNIGYMMAALDLRHPLIAGALLGLGVATRVPIAFCVAFFAWQLAEAWWRREGVAYTRPQLLARAAWFAAPLLVIGGVLMWYNAARFGSPTEFGHAFLAGGAAERIRDHGMFDFAYLNRNLLSALVSVPRFMAHEPYVQVSTHGLGLLFTTPILALVLWPKARPRLRRALWAAIALAAIPGLLYQNTGWSQFGYRFALDYMPYLFALLAIEGRPLTRWVKVAIVFGVIVNLFGAVTFGRYGPFYYETLLPGAT